MKSHAAIDREVRTVAGESAPSVYSIDSVGEFENLREEWNCLYAKDPEAQVFLSWQWLSRLFERRDEPVFLLLCRASGPTGELMAVLPLRRQIRFSRSRGLLYNAVCLAGNHWADYTGVLCLPEAERAALPALGRGLAALQSRRLFLESMRISSHRLNLLLQPFDNQSHHIEPDSLTDNHGATSLDVAPGFRLPGDIDQWLTNCTSANTRQKIRRYRRRLAQDPSLKIRVSTRTTLAADLAFFEEHWQRQWSDLKGARTATLAGKYRAILAPAIAAGEMFAPVLCHDDRPVAMIACYTDAERRELLFYVSARDTTFKVLPAGLLLHAHAIEWGMAEGFEYYDLLRGDEPYKYSLGATDRPVTSLMIDAFDLPVDARFLDPHCRTQGLEIVVQRQETVAPGEVHRLYAQLLESWPGDVEVLGAYEKWLARTGQGDHAESIRQALPDDQDSQWRDCPDYRGPGSFVHASSDFN